MIDINNYSSVIQTREHEATSARYSFIPTTRVIDLLGQSGWMPRKVSQAGTRVETSRGYQKHVVRFAQGNQNVSDEFPEIVLINSHMGTSSFKLMLGIFRLVCSNGLVVGDTFQSFSIKHVGFTNAAVHDATNAIAEMAPRALSQIDTFKGIELNQDEREAFAQAAIEMKFDGDKYTVNPREVLLPRRYSDKDPTLWTTFNTVQENLIRGGVRQQRSDGSRIRSKQVKSIDEDLRINRGLWMLTEKMAQLKSTSN